MGSQAVNHASPRSGLEEIRRFVGLFFVRSGQCRDSLGSRANAAQAGSSTQELSRMGWELMCDQAAWNSASGPGRQAQMREDLGLAWGIGILRLFTDRFDPEARVRTTAYKQMCEGPVMAESFPFLSQHTPWLDRRYSALIPLRQCCRMTDMTDTPTLPSFDPYPSQKTSSYASVEVWVGPPGGSHRECISIQLVETNLIRSDP